MKAPKKTYKVTYGSMGKFETVNVNANSKQQAWKKLINDGYFDSPSLVDSVELIANDTEGELIKSARDWLFKYLDGSLVALDRQRTSDGEVYNYYIDSNGNKTILGM